MDLKIRLVLFASHLYFSIGFPIQVNTEQSYEEVAFSESEEETIYGLILKSNKGSKTRLYEGDISPKRHRSAMVCPFNWCFWPKSSNGLVIIPFVISSSYSPEEKALIIEAIQEYETLTCIHFVDRTTETDYIHISPKDGFAFSNTSGKATIIPFPDSRVRIGQRYGLSNLDVAKINKLYECGVHSTLLSNLTGSFSSTIYQSPYPNNTNSVWLIRLPAHKIFLQFNSLYIQSSSDCASNHILVYDGGSRSDPVFLNKWCRPKQLPSVVSSGNMMLVELVSDGTSMPIFKASYSSVQCGKTFTAVNGKFESPLYPSHYPPRTDCAWIMIAPEGFTVSLKILSFHLEDSYQCQHDYLVIYDGGTSTAHSESKYCANGLVPGFISSGNVVLVKFHSDYFLEYPGFLAEYSFISS